MHTYIHTYMHTCIHAYIHTYIHTYLDRRRAEPARRRALHTLLCMSKKTLSGLV